MQISYHKHRGSENGMGVSETAFSEALRAFKNRETIFKNPQPLVRMRVSMNSYYTGS